MFVVRSRSIRELADAAQMDALRVALNELDAVFPQQQPFTGSLYISCEEREIREQRQHFNRTVDLIPSQERVMLSTLEAELAFVERA